MARAGLAFCIYVAVGALDVSTKVGKHYWSVIAVGVRPFLTWTQHFKDLPQVTSMFPSNQHSHLVLIVALFLVSWRISPRRRLSYFGILAALAFVQDYLAAGLSLRLHEAKALFEQRGWLMLLPWEYNTIDTLWYLVYAIPLQAAPFLLFLLTACWNSGVSLLKVLPRLLPVREQGSPISGTNRRQRGLLPAVAFPTLAVGILAGGLVLGVETWGRIRERDPLHLQTHLYLGNLHFSEGKMQAAEDEYRHIVAIRPVEGEAWLRLAQVRFELGKKAEALAILERGATVVRDGVWVDRIRAGLKDLGSTDPYLNQSVRAAEPSPRP